jgi:hypothetical protein
MTFGARNEAGGEFANEIAEFGEAEPSDLPLSLTTSAIGVISLVQLRSAYWEVRAERLNREAPENGSHFERRELF